jgi:hypothetical protein
MTVIKNIFATILFILIFPIWFVIEGGSTLLALATGGAPKMQSLQALKFGWKLLFGHKVIERQWKVVDGYLYAIEIFDDDSIMYWRN